MPDGIVAITNLMVDTNKKRFSCTLETMIKPKRKFSSEEVSGTITGELAEFFELMREDQVKVVANNEKGYEFIKTGTKSTSFQRWIVKAQREPMPLHQMRFESANLSDDGKANPFKLVRLADGKNILSLVWVAAKKKTDIIDVNTGEIKSHFSKRYYNDGENIRPAFVAPQFYRRLIVEDVKTVELADQSQG